MPSMREPAIVEKAIRCFQAQTYAPKELVIVRVESEIDCGLDSVRDIREYIRCKHLPAGMSIGELRNVASRMARGSIFAHWDDDDWSAPDRIERSVRALEKAHVTGTSLVRYYDPEKKLGWLWDGEQQDKTEQARLGGCTLAYRRAVWEKLGFDDLQVGEDTFFQRKAYAQGFDFADLRDEMLFAGRVHEGNTSTKRPYHPVWVDIPYLEGVF
jgi:glycosyltransferase involved in cell wall biosynthesis